MGALERLEKWKSGHKARAVEIGHDNGYGASCWTVELWGKDNKEVKCSEVSFFCAPKGHEIPRHLVSVMPPERSDWTPEEEEAHDAEMFRRWGDDWPGLEATIVAALDRAEELGL